MIFNETMENLLFCLWVISHGELKKVFIFFHDGNAVLKNILCKLGIDKGKLLVEDFEEEVFDKSSHSLFQLLVNC